VADPALPTDSVTTNGDEITNDDAVTPTDVATDPADAYAGITVRVMDGSEDITYQPIAAQGMPDGPATWSKKGRQAWWDWFEKLTIASPNLDRAPWAILVQQGSESIYTGFEGNCYGLTSGTFAIKSPSDLIASVASEKAYLTAQRLPTDAESVTALDTALRADDADPKLQHAVAAQSMLDEFGATPVEREDQAQYALFGGHIALRLGSPLNMWLSRNSSGWSLYLHSSVKQLEGGTLGPLFELYASTRPITHIVVAKAAPTSK